MPDAVVIGAGPNGLVAANMLLDAGWDVLVLEEQPEPGGAVRSGELTRPGFISDLFSAFYPLAAASPVLTALDLGSQGLGWSRAPVVLAHARSAGSAAVLSMDLDATAASVDAFAGGDGDAWRRMFSLWQRIGKHLIEALFEPFPPVLPAVKLAAALGPRDLARFTRMAVLPIRRFAEEEFDGEGAALLLAGNAMHTDLMPESPAGTIFGWLLSCLGQDIGFPVPEGGAGRLTEALVRRFTSGGGTLECNQRVVKVIVRSRRAVGVRTASGDEVQARRAVLAGTGAPELFLDLVGAEHLPARTLEGMRRFQYDNATVKVDWALDAPIPWTAAGAHSAGTVHIADGMDDLSDFGLQLGKGMIPARPFLIVGQMTTSDATRSPSGTESAWAYTHVPQEPRGDAAGDLTGTWDERESDAFALRIEDRIEELAPGFKEVIGARHIFTPPSMQAADANLVGGAINGGTAQIHQQLIFRPYTGLGRPETPIKNLYLASASAHPGGGVHGAPGANAARAALLRERLKRTWVVAGAAGAAAGAGWAARRPRYGSE
ncbi:MAG: phytoene desaturase family protein [Actinomycetota bacterium]